MGKGSGHNFYTLLAIDPHTDYKIYGTNVIKYYNKLTFTSV